MDTHQLFPAPVCLCLTLMLATASYAQEARVEQLLSNASLEEGEVGAVPPDWHKSGYDGKAYPKDFTLAIANDGRTGNMAVLERPAHLHWVYAQQFIRSGYKGGERYCLTVWLRADRPLRKCVDLVLIPLHHESATKPTYKWARKRFDVGTEWARCSITLHTDKLIVPGQREVTGPGMRALVQLYTRAKIFIDDARLERGVPLPSELAMLKVYRDIAARDANVPSSPIGIKGGIVVSRDGSRLMAFNESFKVAHSDDGGRTWGAFEPLDVPDKTNTLSGVIRLASGRLGIWTESWSSPMYWWSSDNDGKTWSKRVKMGESGAPLHGNVMIQTSKGRLVIPVRRGYSVHSRLWNSVGSYGLVDGKRVKTEGHAHAMEMDVTFVYHSDDEGQTWRRSEGHLIVWKDDGYGGMWPCDEPNVVELKGGRLLMFARTTLGRIYQSFSDDGGHRWSYPEPTQLASSYSPCCLRRIPQTGDLLCIWNQVSADEIRSGYRRGRLTAAISADDGKTWSRFRTVDTAGLPEAGRVEPPVPGMVRGRDDLGELPRAFGTVSYPDVYFHGDTVLVKYSKRLLGLEYSRVMLRILPVSWFYEA